MYAYVTAERRGRDSLRRFLLDLDAKEANEAEGRTEAECRTIAEIVELFLEKDAHPSNEEGLAPVTYEHYTSVLDTHLLGKPRKTPENRRRLPAADYAVVIAATPAERFNHPHTPRAWREQMRQAGVPRSTRVRAWRALSSALSWASASPLVPEIETNGCKLAKEPIISSRRSARRGGTGYGPGASPRPLASWALSPQAVEGIYDTTRPDPPILSGAQHAPPSTSSTRRNTVRHEASSPDSPTGASEALRKLEPLEFVHSCPASRGGP
jgi:hypothetical protein